MHESGKARLRWHNSHHWGDAATDALRSVRENWRGYLLVLMLSGAAFACAALANTPVNR